MTEPAPATPRFTRRRVLLGAIVLVLGLAVAASVFVLFDGKETEPVKVSFLRFTRFSDGKSDFAVLKVRNLSRGPLYLIQAVEPSAEDWPIYMTHGRFIASTSSDEGKASAYEFGVLGSSRVLEPKTEATVRVVLLRSGLKGRFEVHCGVQPRKLPGFLAAVRKCWWWLCPPRLSPVWAVCDQEIQCPRVRPDGTVVPPRLLP